MAGGARAGAGRKPDAEPKVLVNVRLTESEKCRIKEAAKKYGETPSTFMRKAILRALS